MTSVRARPAVLVALVALVTACGDAAAVPSANTVTVPEPATTVVVDGGVLDGSWRAVRATVDGVDVADLDTVEVTLEVSGGTASGSSGCNSYVRPILVGTGTIEFGQAEVSEAGCSGPIGEIEGQFRRSTSATVDWSIIERVLTLTTPTSVWVFERTGAAPAPTTAVTTTPPTTPPATDMTGPESAGLDPAGGLDGPVMYASATRPEVAVDDTAVGSLFLGDDCLGVMRDDGVTIALVVWPYGTRWEADPGAVILPSGQRISFDDVVQVDGTVVDDVELAAYTTTPAVLAEIDRCRRTETTLLFVAA